jgi:hypothetical protein
LQIVKRWGLPAGLTNKILAVHADFLDDRREDLLQLQEECFRRAFEDTAKALTDSGRLTERALIYTIPKMVCHVARVCRWSPSAPFSPKYHDLFWEHFFAGSVIRWRQQLGAPSPVKPAGELSRAADQDHKPTSSSFARKSEYWAMNLTREQSLLEQIVAVYNAGDTSEFVIQSTHGGDSLLYDGGPVAISNGDSDFRQLEREGMITLERDSAGRVSGNPTQLGIEAVANLHRGSSAQPAKARDNPNAAREQFEKNRRDYPADLPDITLEYIINSFDTAAREIASCAESAEDCTQALEALFKAKLSETSEIVSTWPPGHAVLPFLRTVPEDLLKRKNSFERKPGAPKQPGPPMSSDNVSQNPPTRRSPKPNDDPALGPATPTQVRVVPMPALPAADSTTAYDIAGSLNETQQQRIAEVVDQGEPPAPMTATSSDANSNPSSPLHQDHPRMSIAVRYDPHGWMQAVLQRNGLLIWISRQTAAQPTTRFGVIAPEGRVRMPHLFG